ncbi:MAG: RraA family protein [Candidatus Bathyarchaeota archaeon]|nr:RraA family protein [Candidatus Bathyarchaeota archaeon]
MSREFIDEFLKNAKIKRPPQKLLNEFKNLETSLIYDTLWQNFGIDTHLLGLKPIFDFMKDKVYVGTAITAKEVSTIKEPIKVVIKRFEETGRSRIDHILACIDFAEPGDIIVIDGEGREDLGLWGDNTSMLAKRNGICAVILYGAVRDVAKIRKIGFPVFAKGISPKSSGYDLESIGFNVPVTCGGVQVRPGDIIVGDEDGVINVPLEYAERVLEQATEIQTKEKMTEKAIKKSRYALESYPAGRPEILKKIGKLDKD